MRVRRLKPLIFLICFALMSALLANVKVYASDNNTITMQANVEVKQGDYCYGYIYIDSLEEIATLSVSVHYDTNIVNIRDSYNQALCTLYDKSNQNGTLSFSYIFGNDNPSSKTLLFYFYYNIKDDATIGSSLFDILVDDAYDSGLDSVNVSGSRFNFNVNERAVTKTVNVYGTSSISSKKEEEFELNYSFNNYEIASGAIEIRYDKDLFEFVSLQQSCFLDGKLVDVNTSLIGSINISFVTTDYNNRDTAICNVKFRTKANITDSSIIDFVVSDLYDLELNPVLCSGYQTTINLTYDSSYDDSLAKMYLSPTYDQELNKVSILVKLSSNSNLGAGDFVLYWDSELLVYDSYQKKFSPDFFNVNIKQVSGGILKFSIISLTDIADEEDVLLITFNVNNPHNDEETQLTISGSGLADSLTNPIEMSFVDCNPVIIGKCIYGSWIEIVNPTCLETGVKGHYECSRCHKYFDIDNNEIDDLTIAALGHNLEHIERVEAACTTNGNIEYYHCTRCDKYFTDSECENEITYDDTIINKLGHDPLEAVKENNVEPTCEAKGSYDMVVYCSRCGEELSRTHYEVDVLGHDMEYVEIIWTDFEAEAKYKCSRCEHVEMHSATITSEITTEPTCETTGIRTYTATYEGHTSIKEETIDALGHNYGDAKYTWNGNKCTATHVCQNDNTHVEIEEIIGTYVKVSNATCVLNEKGKYIATFTNIAFTNQESEVFEIENSELGHNMEYFEIVWIEYEAKAIYKCSRCSHTIEYEALVTSEITLEPTYDSTGIMLYTATYDGHTSTKEKEIASLNHEFGSWINEASPTCTSKGIKGHYHCTECGRDFDADYGIIDDLTIAALGHNLEHITRVEATCTTNGNIEYYNCVRCDKYFSDNECENEIAYEETIINKLGHDPLEAVKENNVEPTCEAKGSYDMVGYCSRCGEELSRTHYEVDALGHDYGDWEVYLKPTINNDGIERRTCKRCNHYEERTISKLVKVVIIDGIIKDSTDNEMILTIGSKITILSKEIDGKEFFGWSTKENGEVEYTEKELTITVSENISYYAIYKDIKKDEFFDTSMKFALASMGIMLTAMAGLGIAILVLGKKKKV